MGAGRWMRMRIELMGVGTDKEFMHKRNDSGLEVRLAGNYYLLKDHKNIIHFIENCFDAIAKEMRDKEKERTSGD